LMRASNFNVPTMPTQRSGLHARSPRHLLGMGLRVIWSRTAIGSTAPLSRADCQLWASGTSPPHYPRPSRLA
jgi:hypothetical protein